MQSLASIDKSISEGTKRKAEALLRLKQKNEDKLRKVEMTNVVKELEEEERKQKLLLELTKGDEKLSLALDFKKLEQQRLVEQRKRKLDEKKLVQEEISHRD